MEEAEFYRALEEAFTFVYVLCFGTYLEALHAEISSAANLVKELDLKIKSFYMGGGTPTTLTADQMDRLLNHLHSSFDQHFPHLGFLGETDALQGDAASFFQGEGVQTSRLFGRFISR